MAENLWDEPVGSVLRSSTTGFSAGTRIQTMDNPLFGSLVKAQPRSGSREQVFGLLYDIHIDDDPLVRQLVLAENVSEEMVQDQHHHRLAPVEMRVLTIGYRTVDGGIRLALPPRPPMSLDPVFLCNPEESREAMGRFDFFRTVLSASGVPGEQLLAQALLNIAAMLPDNEQYNYLVQAGREAARLLSGDIDRLDYMLRLIYPA